MKIFARAAFAATFVAFMATSPAHSIPNENYKRTVQMLEGQDVTQFTLTPTPAERVDLIYVSNGDTLTLGNPDGSATLTPTKLYEISEVQAKKITSLKNTVEMMRERFNNATLNFEARIKALEEKLQKTRDQIANIVRMQRAKGGK